MASEAEIILPGIRLVLADGWRREHASELHGAYVMHVATGLQVHARGWRAVDPRTELYEQQWASPPFDVAERIVGSRRTVSGTFQYPGRDKLVREWFVVDGERAANAALLFAPPCDLEPFEWLVDSIELR